MEDHLKIHHSSQFEVNARSSTYCRDYSKSDLDVTLPFDREIKAVIPIKELVSHIITKGEYYKRYEHDEVPVKDSSTDEFSPRADNKELTKHDLGTGIQSNVSQELQTDECSLSTLGSNIRFFKTTVQKIFDNFYTSMRDFEQYKKRFQEILDRSKEGSLDGMEDFIKDMFEHIISADNSIGAAVASHTTADTGTEPRDESGSCSGDMSTEPGLSSSILEAYKNDNYLTDSADESYKGVRVNSKVEDILNIFLLGDNPCVQTQINNRKLLSEINIRESKAKSTSKSIASADNLKKLAAKKLQVEQYTKEDAAHNIPEKNIPVKISYAKKNIYLNEDFVRIDNVETSKSLLSKICSVLCKKFRKSTFG